MYTFIKIHSAVIVWCCFRYSTTTKSAYCSMGASRWRAYFLCDSRAAPCNAMPYDFIYSLYYPHNSLDVLIATI